MKTSELTGHALNWVVNQIEECCDDPCAPLFSTDWSQGGPIIEREGIAIDCLRLCGDIDEWVAALPSNTTWEDEEFVKEYNGPTPLVAAMRCYVASKLGDEVDVPDELMKSLRTRSEVML